MKLTDTQRRYLTELIGECWHEMDTQGVMADTDGIQFIVCKHCSKDFDIKKGLNRTFLTPDDFFAVVRAISDITYRRALIELNVEYIYQQHSIMKQPTFIEDFMREVCRLGGIE